MRSTKPTHSEMLKRVLSKDQPSEKVITSTYTATLKKYIKQCEADLLYSFASEKFDPERTSLDTLLGKLPATHPALSHLRRPRKLKAMLKEFQLESSWK